jgi:hypothetical protein
VVAEVIATAIQQEALVEAVEAVMAVVKITVLLARLEQPIQAVAVVALKTLLTLADLVLSLFVMQIHLRRLRLQLALQQ